MKSTAKLLILFTLTASLAACGGGGGGGAAAPATNANSNTNTSAASATPTPAPEPATVVTAAVAASYAAGTEEANTFALLNAERQKCGFGSLVQSTQLDQAAAAHASYLVTNNLGYGHYEAGGLPGFTGTTEQDRATAAGYANANPVGADLATSSGPVPAAGTLRTTRFVRGLLASPFHLLSLVGDSFADLGIGYSRKTSGATEIQALNITLGRRPAINDLAADQVYSYPCDGSAGVNPGLANETPSPIPLNLTQNYLLYGTPIAVKVRIGKALAVTSVTVTPSIGGPAVPVQIVTTANDPQGGALMRPDSAYVLPLAPLQAGKSYTVNLAGASDGVPFTKSFSFSTGL